MFSEVSHIEALLVEVREHRPRTVWSRHLNLGTKLGRPSTPQELPSILELLHFRLYLLVGLLFLLLGDEYLLRRKILKYLVLNLKDVHTKDFIQLTGEVLTQIVEGIEYLFFMVHHEQFLL